MGVSDSRRFGAAERAVRPVGRAGTAGTAAPLGWIWRSNELTLTSHQSVRLGGPTCDLCCFDPFRGRDTQRLHSQG
eukprot:812747-Alexandrium_andersonii.AAC.1